MRAFRPPARVAIDHAVVPNDGIFTVIFRWAGNDMSSERPRATGPYGEDKHLKFRVMARDVT